MLQFTLSTAYTVNGGKVRRQVMGMPMGIPHAPQMANLACYVVEKQHVLTTKQQGVICRYIDDFFASGCTPPPQEAYGMAYSKTSSDTKEVVYLGVRCRIQGDRVRTTLFDREEDYPFHITRYPEWETTAPRTQLGGVLMGRYIACLEACSHMQDFKESVANIVRHATWRNYPPSLIKSVWARFLQKRWQSADIRGRELINWFKKMMEYLWAQGVQNRPPNPRIPQPSIRNPQDPAFWSTFGRQPPPPAPPGVTQDKSQTAQQPPPLPPWVTQDTSQLPLTTPPPATTRLPKLPAQRAEKQRIQYPEDEDDEDSQALLLAIQRSLEHQAGACQDSTPSFFLEGQQTAEWERHPSGLNIGHAQPGLSSCAASSSGARGQTHQENTPTPALPCAMDCDSSVPLPDCTSTVGVGAAHGDPRTTEPMCAGVVFTTEPQGNPPHECMSGPSTLESAMVLDQPVVEQALLQHPPHVSREVILVDRPVPQPYPVPVPVDRPYPVEVPVPVEKLVLVQVPVYIPTLGWPSDHRPPSQQLLCAPARWPAGFESRLQGRLQEQPRPLEIMAPPTFRQSQPEAAAHSAQDTLALLPPPDTPQPAKPAAARVPFGEDLQAPLPPANTSQTADPILLGWHPPENQPLPTLTPLKRPADGSPEDGRSSQGGSPRASKRTLKWRKMEVADWPPEWVDQYHTFRESAKHPARRKLLWEGMSFELRRQVWYRVSPSVREQMDAWDADINARQARQEHAADHPEVEQPEATSHNWKEGARIGEAKNPGPSGRNRSGSRAPRGGHQQFQAQDRRHGSWATPTPSAGERTKGIYPGPDPPDDHAGNRPDGNGGRQGNTAAMFPSRPSREVSELRNSKNQQKSNQQQHQAQQLADVAELIRHIEQQLQAVQAAVRRWSPTPASTSQQVPIIDENPWSVIGPRRRRRNRTNRHSRDLSVDPRQQEEQDRRQVQQQLQGINPPPQQQPRRTSSGGYAPWSGHGPAYLPGGSSQQGKLPGRGASQPSPASRSGRVPAPMPRAPPGPHQEGRAQGHQRQPGADQDQGRRRRRNRNQNRRQANSPSPAAAPPQRCPPPPYQPRRTSPPPYMPTSRSRQTIQGGDSKDAARWWCDGNGDGVPTEW